MKKERPLTPLQKKTLEQFTRRWIEAPLLVKSGPLLALKRRGLLEMRIKPSIANISGAGMGMPYHGFPYEWRKTAPAKPMCRYCGACDTSCSDIEAETCENNQTTAEAPAQPAKKRPCRKRAKEQANVVIKTDGVTVWVDNEVCIGRFGRMGIDVHKAKGQQGSGDGECLHCTHAKTTVEDWKVFQEKMLEHHGVTVDNKYAPTRFKKERCPTCAAPVVSIFDHIDEDCSHD